VVQRGAEFLAEFAEELSAAHDWYAQRSPIAAEALRAETEQVIAAVLARPDRYRRYLSGTRRALLPSFPYKLVYRISGNTIVSAAFAHAKRRPG
jgi:toxin ParE1/3/4